MSPADATSVILTEVIDRIGIITMNRRSAQRAHGALAPPRRSGEADGGRPGGEGRDPHRRRSTASTRLLLRRRREDGVRPRMELGVRSMRWKATWHVTTSTASMLLHLMPKPTIAMSVARVGPDSAWLEPATAVTLR